MTKKINNCCGDDDCGGVGCCQVEAMVSVDERGQMVLPKSIREKAKIKAGSKLAVVSWGQGEASCLCLIKADSMNKLAKEFLGPIMKRVK